jgi:triacylglycerol esterase/lipase EstA (alpha/beta hydrolase family)
MANGHPVVLVHGLFGWGPGEVADFPYWGTGRSVACPLPRREASVGPVSSLHDRACELAFQIKGGRVDYGAAHARRAGHDRYGRTYGPDAALHPDWSARRPVHLVGHSMGGPTVVLCQQLLEEDYFGWGSNHRWVASISSISGVLNGSTATYLLGCSERTGLLSEDTVGDFVGHAIEVTLRATGSLFDRFYDFDLDHWGIGANRDEPLGDYVDRIAASPMFRGKDNAAYSVTVQGLLAQNARCRTYPGTYYFSYVTAQTVGGFVTGHHYPEPDMNPFLIPTSIYIGRKRFARPFYAGFASADWWPNDGLVPVYSQLYPRTAGRHPVGGAIDDAAGFRRGRWYHQLLDDMDHIDIVALPQLDQVGRQKTFYRNLYNRLAAL